MKILETLDENFIGQSFKFNHLRVSHDKESEQHTFEVTYIRQSV